MTGQEGVSLSDRWKIFLNLLFLGDAPPLPDKKIEDVSKRWPELREFNRLKLIKDLQEQVIRKRQSIGENAARGSYKFAGIAFIVAAGVSLLVAPETAFAAKVLVRISISVLLASSGMLLLVISAKGKVMRRELNNVPRGVEAFDKALSAQKYNSQNPTRRYWMEYYWATYDLHKCEMLLLAERRGAFIAAAPSVIVLVAMIVSVCIA